MHDPASGARSESDHSGIDDDRYTTTREEAGNKAAIANERRRRVSRIELSSLLLLHYTYVRTQQAAGTHDYNGVMQASFTSSSYHVHVLMMDRW